MKILMTEKKQQRRLRHYIGAPKRFLRRARDLYVDSLVTFDGKVGAANIVACPTTHARQSFGSTTTTKLDKDQHLQQLYRSISDKYCNRSSTELDRLSGYGAMGRSYSIAVGKMGRIDEEEPCDFHHHVVIPRTTSLAGYYYCQSKI